MDNSTSAAKREVCAALGEDSSKLYFALLKSWFRGELNRDDFDKEARKLFANHSVHHHNQFLLALFSKCSLTVDEVDKYRTMDGIGQSAGRRKRKAPSEERREEKRNRVLRMNVTDPNLAEDFLKLFDPQDFLEIPTCSGEGVIPGPETVGLRAMLSAVEQDLDYVDRDAVSVVLLGVYDILRNIIMEMLKLRKPYSVRCGRFPHKFGYSQLREPRTDMSESTEERDRLMSSTAELKDPAITYTSLVLPNHSVSLTDLMHVLAPPQGHSVLPVHSVWLTAFERTMNTMHQEGAVESLGYQAGLE